MKRKGIVVNIFVCVCVSVCECGKDITDVKYIVESILLILLNYMKDNDSFIGYTPSTVCGRNL